MVNNLMKSNQSVEMTCSLFFFSFFSPSFVFDQGVMIYSVCSIQTGQFSFLL